MEDVPISKDGLISVVIPKPKRWQVHLYGTTFWTGQEMVPISPWLETMAEVFSIRKFLEICKRLELTISFLIKEDDDRITPVIDKGIPVEGFWSKEFEDIAFDRRPTLSEVKGEYKAKLPGQRDSVINLRPVCDKCGGDLYCDTSMQLSSYPPQYNVHCRGCKNVAYINCSLAHKSVRKN